LEDNMTEEEKKRLAAQRRASMMSGILGFGRDVYQGNPLLRAIGDPIRDVYRNYDVALQGGAPQIVMSDAHPSRQTVEINRPLGYTGKQPGKGGAPTAMYGVPQRVRGLGTGSEAYKPAGPRGGQLTGPMAENPLVPARQTPMKEEEDEFGFLDAMFLANLVAGAQGGPPPTPYGTAVGGGNKTWASLPTLMRMS
jgi:hypothetical protein